MHQSTEIQDTGNQSQQSSTAIIASPLGDKMRTKHYTTEKCRTEHQQQLRGCQPAQNTARAFPKIQHTSYKTNIFKRIKMIQLMFFIHCGIKLGITKS